MRTQAPTRSRPTWPVGFLFLLVLLLAGLPADAQAIKVTSAVPDIADQGTVGLVVTIGGENFTSGSRVAFYVTGTKNPGGIAVKSVRFKDSKTLEASIDVAPDAQTDLKFDIEVKSGSRTGKGTELFKVNVKVTGGDLTPPGTVDVQAPVADIGFNTALLTWIAPADDGYVGSPAAKYDIRVRKATPEPECGPYTMDVWVDDTLTGIWNDPCHAYYSGPTPGAPGNPETATALFLAPETEYYAVVRAADDSPQGPNWSDIPSPGTPGSPGPQLLFKTGKFPPEGWTAPWEATVVDGCPPASTTCRIFSPVRLDLDSTGRPSMLYLKSNLPTLASWTGSEWTTEVLPIQVDTGSWYYDFGFDPDLGHAAVASIVPSAAELRYHERVGSAWQAQTVASASFGGGTVLSFAPLSSAPTIAFGEQKRKDTLLRVAQRFGGSWTTETAASGVYRVTSLAFDDAGDPAVAFTQTPNGVQKLAVALRKGGTWAVEYPDANPPPPAWDSVNEVLVAFDPSRHDFTAVARYANTATWDYILRLCDRTGGSWSCETVSEGPAMRGLALAIDGQGKLYLTFRLNTDFFMRIRTPDPITGAPPSWSAEYIHWNVGNAAWTSLRLGPDGQPVIAFNSAHGPSGAGGSDRNYSISFARRTAPAP